jgi:hypothetical protein
VLSAKGIAFPGITTASCRDLHVCWWVHSRDDYQPSPRFTPRVVGTCCKKGIACQKSVARGGCKCCAPQVPLMDARARMMVYLCVCVSWLRPSGAELGVVLSFRQA